ncbi:hypothetical protein K505DRAFT_406918 [Melanomma pulvis-pyrius CBS 109.77]|uniref:Clr5 domain-containing protein n=1 Tax=Melanomma pulvis-pyrius CBS 109.77 TaxID=1314802 RepID=A0A6A6XG69_9PLEO|nr:hypothetical protein K505DRAFT_406918 [Melanomma pulvis-pyrius CBS 109.77]
MHEEHRPDFAKLRKSNIVQHCVLDTFLWPQVNLEDLMKPKHLLLVLNARGRHPPHIFTQADIEAAVIGHAKERDMKGYMENYYMVFRKRVVTKDYGDLIHCSNPMDAAKKIASGHGVHPAHEFQILNIQHRIWDFLVDCCWEIMHDVDLHDMRDPTPVQPEPTPISTDSEVYNSLDISSLEAPYRVPITTDFSRILSLTLRSYMGIDLHGNGGLVGLVTDAYTMYNDWHVLAAQMTNLQKLWQDYAADIAKWERIPEDFQDAFETVRFTLVCMCDDYIHELSYGIYSCPDLRQFFDRKPPTSSRDLPIQANLKSKSFLLGMSTEARLANLIAYLWEDTFCKDVGVVSLMDRIERLLQKEPRAKYLVTPWVRKVFGKLSVVAECLRQLHLFPDWALFLEHAMMTHKDEHLKRVEQRQHSWKKILQTKFRAAPLTQFSKLAHGSFNYPSDKRRNQKNVETMRSAEAKIDNFWSVVDEQFETIPNVPQHDFIQTLLTGGRVMQRTPPWVDVPTEAARGPPSPQADYIYEPLSQTLHESSKQITGAFDKLSISTKEKPKTRGIAMPIEEPAEPDLALENDLKQVISLDKRSYKVFKTIFHSPNSPDHPGEIAWVDLLHAIVAAGFSAEKLHGSAWQFTPRDLDVGRSILFHEPHPTSKILFTWARRFGRRLTRA